MSSWLVSGGTAGSYGLASLAMVCLNHKVLDDYAVESTSLILVLQMGTTLLISSVLLLVMRSSLSSVSPSEAQLSRQAAPRLALLLVLDIVFGHAATRSLGLDAFATLRRCCIPIAAHLEPRFLKTRRATIAIIFSAWSMVLGPAIGTVYGQRKGFAFDAFSVSGIFFATASAFVVAARVVYLKSVLILREDLRRRSEIRSLANDEETRQSHMIEMPILIGRNTKTKELNRNDQDQKIPSTKMSHRRQAHFHRNRRSFEDDTTPHQKPRRFQCYHVLTSDSSIFIFSLLARTALVALPCVLGFGLSFEAAAMHRSLARVSEWHSGIIFSFISLCILGPVHETTVCACTLYNSALTTLIAGGFKSTALTTYRAAVHQTSATDPADLVGMAISSIASLVYTHEWWLEQHRREQVRREFRLADLATTDLIAEDSDDDDDSDDDESATLLPHHTRGGSTDLQRRDQHYDHIPILHRSHSTTGSRAAGGSSIRRGSSLSRGSPSTANVKRQSSNSSRTASLTKNGNQKKGPSSSLSKSASATLPNAPTSIHHPPAPGGGGSPNQPSMPRPLGVRRPPPE